MAVNQWDKGSSYNGPNAHKKGNRTHDRRRPQEMINTSMQYSEDVTRYKEQAEAIRKSKKFTQEDLYKLYTGLNDYIRERTDETFPGYIGDKPLTISGMILAAGVSKDTWYSMLAGEYDYKLYQYIDMHNIDIAAVSDNIDGIPYITDDDGHIVMLITYGAVVQKAVLCKEAQTEERLYDKGRVGDIFSLKALHGWKEDASPSTVNQTLVIASEEQARKAIDLLK